MPSAATCNSASGSSRLTSRLTRFWKWAESSISRMRSGARLLVRAAPRSAGRGAKLRVVAGPKARAGWWSARAALCQPGADGGARDAAVASRAFSRPAGRRGPPSAHRAHGHAQPLGGFGGGAGVVAHGGASTSGGALAWQSLYK